MDIVDLIYLALIALATGLGGTVIGGLSYFRKFKKISRKWFLGGLIASSICASIGIAAWVGFTNEYLSPFRIFLQESFFMGTYCMVLGTFGIVSCVRALIAWKREIGRL